MENLEKRQEAITPVQPNKSVKKAAPNIKYLREKDRELVTGVFRFHECPGGTLSFNYRKWKEDAIERYDLTDGQIYKIPFGVAKHLANSGWYPVHAHELDEHGKPQQVVAKKVRRYGFDSLEFVDLEGIGTRSVAEEIMSIR